jgi:hypothetical protein
MQKEGYMTADAAATRTPFYGWWKRGFGPRLVGVIPHDAKLAPGTDVNDANRGKVPGRLREDGWVGLGGKFIDRPATTQNEAKQWQKDGAQVGIFAQFFPGLDIDVNDEQVARDIQEIAFDIFGETPVRWRKKSARRLMMYRSTKGDLRKRRVAFKINPDDEVVQAVELLGQGQYYNVDGIHPSGEPYRWSDNTFKADSLVEINDAKLDKFIVALVEYLETFGHPIVKQTSGSSSTKHDRKGLDDEALWAPTPERVLALLKAVPCDETTFETRDDFVKVLAAIKGALGEARDDYWPQVLEWALGYPGAEDDYITKIWESYRDVALGWSFLEAWARTCGYDGETQIAFDDGVGEQNIINQIVQKLPDDHPMKETALEKAQRTTVFCYEQDKFFDMDTGMPLSSNSFNAKNIGVAEFGSSGKNAAVAMFMNDPKSIKVNTVTYLAGNPERITQMPDGSLAFNLWRPGPMKPAKNVTPDAVKPWLDHMAMIFGERGTEASDHILDYMAHVVQRRGVKINHAVVIYGETQGTGKDSALVPLLRYLGDNNVENISPEQVTSQFNGFLRNEMLIINEMINFEKLAVMNKMKPWLAAPPHTLPINVKYMKAYNIPNTVNVIITTNYGDAIRMDDTDRRFWVHEVELQTPREPDYYRGLYQWYADGGCEKVIGWLMQRDLRRFDPSMPPPMTAAKKTMIGASLTKEAQQLARLFDEGEALGNRKLMTVRELLNHARVVEGISAGDRHATSVLKHLRWHPTDRMRAGPGSPVRVWCRDAKVATFTPAVVAQMYADDIKAAGEVKA